MNVPSSLIGTFQGNAQAFQTSLASEPYLIAAAIIVSQALTLYTTPVVYLYLDQLGVWLRRRRSGAALTHAPSVAE
jgi:multidrug efflux pump subunit AcrB